MLIQYSQAKEGKKKWETQCTRREKYKHRVKDAVFLCQKRNIGFCASLAVWSWGGREGNDCREVDWAKGSQLRVWWKSDPFAISVFMPNVTEENLQEIHPVGWYVCSIDSIYIKSEERERKIRGRERDFFFPFNWEGSGDSVLSHSTVNAVWRGWIISLSHLSVCWIWEEQAYSAFNSCVFRTAGVHVVVSLCKVLMKYWSSKCLCSLGSLGNLPHFERENKPLNIWRGLVFLSREREKKWVIKYILVLFSWHFKIFIRIEVLGLVCFQSTLISETESLQVTNNYNFLYHFSVAFIFCLWYC